MGKTTADLLIERLIHWGVDTIFSLPGDGINGIFEALRTHRDRIRYVQVRHEEAAAFAACGYAKFTGRLGVCLATSGPGGIHLLNGLYDAKMDGQPVLAIAGHTYHDLIGTNQQQDVDLSRLYADVAVYSERVTGPAHVINAVDEAIRMATNRRGVAALTIPKDIQDLDSSEDQSSSANIKGHSGHPHLVYAQAPSAAELRAAAEVINRGKKVAILAGRGCLNAQEEVLALAEAVAGPIIKPLLGKAVVADDSPYTTGGIGLLGTAPSQEAMMDCDTLVILGSSFPYIEFYPKPGEARGIQVDIDPTRIGRRYPVEIGLVGDCKQVLQALLPQITPKKERDFLEKAQENMRDWRELMQKRGTNPDTPTKPQAVLYRLNQLLSDNALIAADTGTVTGFAARYLDMRGQMQFNASGMLASMGNGLPYAVAAAIAYPGRQVVAIVGDGGFTMMMGELATVAKYKLPIKIIVIKNNAFGQIKWEQIALEGNPEYGIDLYPIDFGLFAKACGIPGYTASDPAQVDEALRRAFADPGPALVEAVVDANEPLLPGNISMEQALKFAKSMLKGDSNRWDILKTIAKDTIREVV
jgi:pyruvate dehydrogenase (quinone)